MVEILGEVVISVPLDKFQSAPEAEANVEEVKIVVEGPAVTGRRRGGGDGTDSLQTQARRRKVARGFQSDLGTIEVIIVIIS